MAEGARQATNAVGIPDTFSVPFDINEFFKALSRHIHSFTMRSVNPYMVSTTHGILNL